MKGTITLAGWTAVLEDVADGLKRRWPDFSATVASERLVLAPGRDWCRLTFSGTVELEAGRGGKMVPCVHGHANGGTGSAAILSEAARLTTALAQALCWAESQVTGIEVTMGDAK